jgi:hypothetical protein
VIRRVKPYNQNADRRDHEVIAFGWPCPLLALSRAEILVARELSLNFNRLRIPAS